MSNISRIDEALRRLDDKLSRMIEEETSFGVSDVDKFRNGVFTLRTRRFGTLAEIMVQRLFGLDTSNTLKYDLKGVDNLGNPIRVEVKFSTVLSKSQSSINQGNLVSQCIEANPLNRMMGSAELKSFDCNIQQVKPSEFDVLFYGLFFSDRVEIYKISSNSIYSIPRYSDKQHRGNIGEGQFHITRDTLEFHRRNMVATLSYSELMELLS